MTEEQIKNGDILLKIFLDAGKPINIDYYDDLAEAQGIDNLTLIYTRENLVDHGLIEYHGTDKYFAKLTIPNGTEAAKYGIKKYYKKKESKDGMGNRLAAWAIVATLVTGLVGYFSGVIDYLLQLFK